MASGSYDHTVKIWNVKTGYNLMTLTGHTGGVDSVNFSPDGLKLASGSDDHTVKIWDVETGNNLMTLTGHNNYVYYVNFSPDG